MIGHIQEKERFPKIGKFMKKSGGFTEDNLRFPRKYLCTFMTCIWHISKVIISSVIFNTLLPFLVFATLVIYKVKQVFEMGGEPRKQESSNYRVWKTKASMWDILQKEKVMTYIERLHGYKPHIMEAFFKN